jgi:hypothetical protein
MRYLIDTARIISEGSDTTIYQNYDLVVTSYVLLEIQNKGLRIDSTSVSVVESPAFSNFENKGNVFSTWSDGTKILQLVQYKQKSYIPAVCGKHDTTAQLSLVGSNICVNICNKVLEDNADFSQVTSLILNNNVKPFGTGDKCLNTTLNKIFNLKTINNSTNYENSISRD